MTTPGTEELSRAELAELGFKHFVDVRVTIRRILTTMERPQRTAFAAAVAKRLLRADAQLPVADIRPYVARWRPVLDDV
ncbi:hypothetical protein K1W54_38760 [Micromonospora sp. CPCC 205371]|nr:hypothetical protein [Micromonospora sp. CPCC 205371]